MSTRRFILCFAWALLPLIEGVSQQMRNDSFHNRSVLTGISNYFSLVNTEATAEGGEPDHCGFSARRSLWYTWTAPFSGGVEIDGAGSMGKPLVAVYVGNSFATLTNVACDASLFGPVGGSFVRLVFTAKSNTTYQLVVDTRDNGTGGMNMTLKLRPPPGHDHFGNAMPIAGNYFETNASFIGATREPGEPSHGATNLEQTVWWRWQAPTNNGLPASLVRLTTDAVSFPPQLSVYTSNLSLLTPVLTSSETNGMTRTSTFSATAGRTYYLALAGTHFTPGEGVVSPRYGNYRFCLNNRGLTLGIQNLVVTNQLSTNFSDYPNTSNVFFGATVRVTNSAAASTRPLRVFVAAVSGLSIKGPDDGNANGGESIIQGIWTASATGLAPGQTATVPISGVAPAPHNIGMSAVGVGYGVFAQLQEAITTDVWSPVDQALVVFGQWPPNGFIIGPGGGVIRLDPNYVGLPAFNPLQSVSVIGPASVQEGASAGYFGRANYASGTSVFFTNTDWSVSLFQITTNGLFTNGSTSSNTLVTVNAPYSSGGMIYTASTNVTISNLPPPVASLRLEANGNLRLMLYGVPNRTHVIEAATNLTPPAAWLSLATNRAGISGTLQVTNLSHANFPKRFFRGRESSP